MIFIHYW